MNLFIFQLKEYELCIRDITRAFDNSYPNNLMYKLFERKARCLKAQKEYPRALEAMKSAEMWMKYSTLSETKSSNFKKDITKQVESLQEKVSAMAISDFSLKNDHRRAMSAPCKGQLISKCLFEVFKSPKKPTKFCKDFCPNL